MKQNNIKIENLSSEIGYDKQHIYGICNGIKAPSAFCLWRILDYLNITYDILLSLYSDSDEKIYDEQVEYKKQSLQYKINFLEREDDVDFIINNVDFINKSRKN